MLSALFTLMMALEDTVMNLLEKFGLADKFAGIDQDIVGNLVIAVVVLLVFVGLIMIFLMMRLSIANREIRAEKLRQKNAASSSAPIPEKKTKKERRAVPAEEVLTPVDMEEPAAAPVLNVATSSSAGAYSSASTTPTFTFADRDSLTPPTPAPQPIYEQPAASQPLFVAPQFTAPEAPVQNDDLLSVYTAVEEEPVAAFEPIQPVEPIEPIQPVVEQPVESLTAEERIQRARLAKEQRLKEYYARIAQTEEEETEDSFDFGVGGDVAEAPVDILATEEEEITPVFEVVEEEPEVEEPTEVVAEPIFVEEPEDDFDLEAFFNGTLKPRKARAEVQEKVRDKLTTEDVLKKIFDKQKIRVPRGTTILPKCFQSYLAQASDETKAIYDKIKNELLSYKGVHSRMLTGVEVFRRSGVQAKVTIKGKTLYLYLRIFPDAIDPSINVKVKDLSHKKAYEETPTEIRISGKKKINSANKLIAAMFEAQDVAKDPDYEFVPFSEEFPYNPKAVVYSRNIEFI